MKVFVPKMYKKDIFQINYTKLKELGYKIIIFDLDNTLGRIKDDNCSKETANFLNNLQKDFQVIVASNSRQKRVFKFLEGVKCDYYALSLKPTLKVLRKIKKKYELDYSEMVIVGDQILTDILVGNRRGLMTILVDPIENRDLKVTFINRTLEKLIMQKIKIIRGKYYEKN